MKTNGGFKNFWDYNKGKVIAGILLIGFIIFGITQCNISPDPRFSILCASETDNYNGDILMQKLSENIDFSKTDEGKQEISYKHINIPPSQEEQSQLGTIESIQNRMINGDCSLLFFDKEMMYFYEEDEGVFVDLREYADKYKIPEENRYINIEGFVCGIKLEKNKFLESCSINTKDMYVAIRVPKDGDVDKYTNAKASLEYILSNK